MIEGKGQKADWKRKLFLEMRAYWINVAYLTLLFAVFTSYRRLILANYDITYSNWGISFIKAMVLAKVVMVGGLFHFGRALEKKPLILATLFNSFLFTIWVALFAAIESALRGLFHGTGFAGAMDHLLSEGAHEFYAKMSGCVCRVYTVLCLQGIGPGTRQGQDMGMVFSERTGRGRTLAGTRE